MPVPESSYSRRYGRDETTYGSSYSRSASGGGLGGGRSSYLGSSYSSGSKTSTTLPPRPPAYEYRKYTDSSVGSRFLSANSSGRLGGGREYGGASTNYRSSVSPSRITSSSSFRRNLEFSAPTLAEKIKQLELGEKEAEEAAGATIPSTRLSSRYSSGIRSRDSSSNKSNTFSSYSRDRSGSKEYSSNPLLSSSLSRGDSNRSSTENIIRGSRLSPSSALSRSGSGGGLRNGVSGHNEVNNDDENNSSSASKGVSVAAANTTMTSTTTKHKMRSVNHDDDYEDDDKDKSCAKDIELNNDSETIKDADKDVVDKRVNGFDSSSVNGNYDSSNVSVTVSAPSDWNGKANGESGVIGGTSALNAMSSGDDFEDGIEKDSNGNPIITTDNSTTSCKTPDIMIMAEEKKSSRKGSASPVSPTPRKKELNGRFLKHRESDTNANNLEETDAPTCNGTRREKSPLNVVLNYKTRSTTSPASKSVKPKQNVIYHTIQIEDDSASANPDPSPSPEPVYTLTARPSLDGTGPKIEIKSVTKGLLSKPSADTNNSNNAVSAEFKVTLPKLRPATTGSSSENVHNNKSATASSEEEAVDDNMAKVTTIDVNVTSMNEGVRRDNRSATPKDTKKESKATSPSLKKTSASPTPEKEITPKAGTPKQISLSKSREPTPNTDRAITNTNKVITAKQKSKSPTPTPPPPSHKEQEKDKQEGRVPNGDIGHTKTNANDLDVMGPHSSRYAYHGVASPNRNERTYGGSYGTYNNTASDSSDNDSDAYASSPHTGPGKFRTKDGYEKAGLTGLRNIGNTCFMNTVLQCLSNSRPLLEYVLKGNYESDINRSTSGMKGALMRAFADVIQDLWRDQRMVDTSAFKDSIQRFAPRFMGYSQQDAQEFLRYLLEGLHEDVNRVTAKPTPITTDIEDSWSDSEKAAESWRRYLRYESSKIVDMFVGQFKSTLKCTVCGHSSVTFDPFWDLSLPIPSRSSSVRLSQCFELLNKEEVLDGDEKPTCSKCQCRRKCTKSLSIQKFPKILVVHLKRFSLAERYRGKLSTLVDYPLTGLDLSTFSATPGNVFPYNLYGVANHSGSTYSGHYIAYCKHPYSGEWHCYNDSRVSPMSAHSVVTSDGYVLFYEQAGQSSLL